MAESQLHPMRVCTKCGSSFPETREHFPPNDGGLRRQCRPCWREREREYFWKNRERKREAKCRAWKLCDKEAQRRRLQAWKAANPEKARAIELRRLEKIKGSPELKAQSAAKMRRWREKNPSSAAAARARRRAREVGAPGEWTREDVREILKIQGRFCFYCSSPLTRFECDHFIPLARGGSNGPENIVLSCGPCNYSKAARLPWEWMPDRFSEGCKPR